MGLWANVCLVVASVALAGCESSSVSGLQLTLPGGYTAYDLPRKDRGPGWVFMFVKNFDGETVQVTVCENLYPDNNTVSDDATFFDRAVNGTTSGNIGLTVLQGLLENIDGTLSATTGLVKSVEVSWKGLTIVDMPKERRFDDEGKIVPVSARCRATLRDMLANDGKLGGVFFVQEALRANSLTLKVGRDTNAAASAGVDIKSLLTVAPGVSYEVDDVATMTFKEPRFIGYKAVAIEQFSPLGAMGELKAKVTGRPLSKKDIESILR